MPWTCSGWPRLDAHWCCLRALHSGPNTTQHNRAGCVLHKGAVIGTVRTQIRHQMRERNGTCTATNRFLLNDLLCGKRLNCTGTAGRLRTEPCAIPSTRKKHCRSACWANVDDPLWGGALARDVAEHGRLRTGGGDPPSRAAFHCICVRPGADHHR